MYSRFTILKKYLSYYISAISAKGHGVHSPFVFDFIKNVLLDCKKYDAYLEVENLRKQLLKNNQLLFVEDFGAGSGVSKTNSRLLSKIASSSLKPRKYAQLLFRIIKHYNRNCSLELGTSLGITSSYIALANPNGKLYTFEGSETVALVATQQFEKLGIRNIEINIGDFEKTLPEFLLKNINLDFVFVDGNHRKIPTLKYFELLLKSANENSIFIFDDIHWSSEMEDAWEIIKSNEKVTLSIDLFFIGIVLFKKDFKTKQNFEIRF